MTLHVLVNTKPWPLCKAPLPAAPLSVGKRGSVGGLSVKHVWFLLGTRNVTELWGMLVPSSSSSMRKVWASVLEGFLNLLDVQKLSSGAGGAKGQTFSNQSVNSAAGFPATLTKLMRTAVWCRRSSCQKVMTQKHMPCF